MRRWIMLVGCVFMLWIRGASIVHAGNAVVGIVRSDYAELKEPVPPDQDLTRAQIEEVVRGAMEAIGGMDAFVGPDDRWVVIKPNIVHALARGSGDITDAYVVWAVVKLVYEANPSARISIAEAPAGWISPGHPEAMDAVQVTDGFANSGFRQIAEDPDLKEAQIDFIDLNFDEADSVKGIATGDFYWRPRTVRDCDVFINVPVLKVTNVIGFTGAMKNMVGIMPGMKYGWAKNQGFPPWSGNPGLPNHRSGLFDEMIVDIVSMARIDLNVVDAIVGLEKGRVQEEGGRPRRLNTIIAGADPVAVDAVCTRLVGFNPDDFEFVTLGERLGLGVGDLDRIELVGQPLSEVETRFEKKPKWDERAHYGQSNRTWLLKGLFDLKDESRWRPDPKTLAPKPGENGWSEPVYFHDDKINLKAYYGRRRDCVAYAYTEFIAPRAQSAELWVGSDEGLIIWLNGDEVYRFERTRRHRLPNDQVPVEIRAGRNTLLVEAIQRWKDFDFSLNVCEPEKDERYDGNRVMGLKFTVPGVELAAAVDGSNITSAAEPIEFAGWHTDGRFPGRIVRTFTVADGLPDDTIRDLTVGPDGSIWAFTRNSVLRFDGEKWKPAFRGSKAFDDTWVRTILVDRQGTFWAATSNGLKQGLGDSIATHIGGQWVGGLAEALGGQVFTGGWEVPLQVFEGDRWRKLDVGEKGPNMRIVSMGGCDEALWVGTWGAGVFRYDGKGWRRFTSKDGLGDNHVERIVAGPNGTVLLYYEFSGVDWFDGKRWHFYDEEDGLLDPEIRGMAIDRKGRPWVSTEDGSLSCLDGSKWATALTNKAIRAIAVDAEDNLWLGGEGGGVSVFSLTEER